MFNTDRLVLRPVRDSDIQNVVELWNDPLVQRGLATGPVVPRSAKFADQVYPSLHLVRRIYILNYSRSSNGFQMVPSML